jgi:1,4-dihydroxy-6-naphthoate synthase
MTSLSRSRERITAPRTLDVAYTPDSDDVFNFYGWEQGHVKLGGFTPRFGRSHIAMLNRAAQSGLYDLVAVSSVMYPLLADKYWVLAVGSSVGRGYGPVLVSKEHSATESLRGRVVAVPGLHTTGGTLARMYCPDNVKFIPMPFNLIADSILAGEVDAGVMIHEELVHFPALGLRRVLDLGKAWSDDSGLPLPVGLNIVKKSLGRETAVEIARACRESLLWGLSHKEEAMGFASRFGRDRADTFVPMFSNDDTLCMPPDVRRGLRVLFDQLADRDWAPRLDSFEVIDA